MTADEQRTLQLLEPLIKIIKDRQLLYFEALSFANKNIESTSNDMDQIFIFNKFLNASALADTEIVTRQTILLNQVGPNQETGSDGYKASNTSKYIFCQSRQMMRLSARVLEILDVSVEKARPTLFGQSGRLGIDFIRFKKALHRTIRQQAIDLADFSTVIINFVKNKYRRQIGRIRNYLNLLQAGENVNLKDLFFAEGSDASVSPQDKPYRHNNKSVKPKKKLLKQASSPEQESPSKRQSTKKVIQHGLSKPKRTLNLKTTKHRDQIDTESVTQKQKKLEKSATAALLLKFYNLMQLNKKQFLEDYVFERHQQQKQRKRLITELMERNIKNSEQINQYFSKCEHYNPSLNNLNNHNSSDQNQSSSVYRNQSSVNSRASMRTSFVISRRKGSFVYETPSDKSDIESNPKNIFPISRTIKNFSPAKKTQEKRDLSIRPKAPGQSKKIFVIKSPLTFDDEIIPKVQMTNAAWIQPPLTGRDKNRRNEHIRLKKRNNPVPLDQKYLPQSFRFSQYPI